MKSKRLIMGYAALLILFFHFYIPVLGVKAETVFLRTSYVGVDLFFFLSGYSLGKRKEFKTIPFYLNRLKTVYFPFAVLSVICALYKKWKFSRLISVLIGKELFERNGGAFLWFFPALILLYLFVPLFVMAKEKWGYKALPILLVIWALVTFGLQNGAGYKNLSILLMRVPIFLLGFFPELWEKIKPGKWKIPLFLALWIIGWVLMIQYGALNRLNRPTADFYYIVSIVRTIGIVGIFEMIPQVKLLYPIEFLGAYTAELYGLQMVFGYDIEMYLLKLTGKPMLAFLLTLLGLIAGAVCFQWIIKKIIKIVFERKEITK